MQIASFTKTLVNEAICISHRLITLRILVQFRGSWWMRLFAFHIGLIPLRILVQFRGSWWMRLFAFHIGLIPLRILVQFRGSWWMRLFAFHIELIPLRILVQFRGSWWMRLFAFHIGLIPLRIFGQFRGSWWMKNWPCITSFLWLRCWLMHTYQSWEYLHYIFMKSLLQRDLLYLSSKKLLVYSL